MRRISLLTTLLIGSTTLSLAASAQAAPPEKPPAASSSPTTTVVRKGNKVIVNVAPPPQGDDKKGDDKKGDEKATEEKADKPKEDPIERTKRGVVTIERAGEVVGLGTVLGNDGRVLTALSNIGDGNNLEMRYADGTTSKAKLGHSDRAWDLAMLVPQAGKWPEGLSPSEGDPLRKDAKLRSFVPGKGKPQAANIAMKSRRSLLGADETPLKDVLEMGTKIGPREFGTPVVDESGGVVAMVGRACMPVDKGPCLPTPVGVPVSSIRSFLKSAPPSALQPAPWLGIQGVAEKGPLSGIRVLRILPDSPADDGGLKVNADKAKSDLIVAVDDQPVQSLDQLSKAVKTHSVGDKMKLLVLRDGKLRESTVVLRPAPPKN